MELVALPNRPVPDGVRAGMLATPDKVAIRYARWEATGAPRRGTVVICHGRSEFIEKYFEVVDELRARGFGVLTFDWRGQGGSGRLTGDMRKGHVRRFADYQVDLETIMTTVGLPDCRPPFHALGHSMGGAILIETAKAGRIWFDRMVLSAPMVALAPVRRPGLVRTALTLLSALGLSTMTIPGGSLEPTSQKPFEGNPVSSDPVRYALAASYADIDGRLGLGAPTLGWVRSALTLTSRFAHPLYARGIRQPMLLVGCARDPLIDTSAIEAFGRRLKAGHTVVIPGSLHEVMMERDELRAQFWAAFDAFVPGEQAFL
jgi:lysophospholipase